MVAHLDSHGWLSAANRTTWAQGVVGIAYDRQATGRDITRITDLFQPELHARVALPADARSTLGQGTEIAFTLPAAKGASAPA